MSKWVRIINEIELGHQTLITHWQTRCHQASQPANQLARQPACFYIPTSQAESITTTGSEISSAKWEWNFRLLQPLFLWRVDSLASSLAHSAIVLSSQNRTRTIQVAHARAFPTLLLLLLLLLFSYFKSRANKRRRAQCTFLFVFVVVVVVVLIASSWKFEPELWWHLWALFWFFSTFPLFPAIPCF